MKSKQLSYKRLFYLFNDFLDHLRTQYDYQYNDYEFNVFLNCGVAFLHYVAYTKGRIEEEMGAQESVDCFIKSSEVQKFTDYLTER